jgi:hypothetical protein
MAKYDYNKLHPEAERKMATTFVLLSHEEEYHAFGDSLFKTYDIQPDANAYPVVTSNTQLPPNHMFPELVKSKDSVRKSFIADMMIPLVIFWCKDARFADAAIEVAGTRTAYW